MIVIIGFIDQNDDRQSIYDEIDYYFVIVYLLEFVMKVVALGILGYFRDNWNKMDFGLIVISLSTDFAFSMFKVLRNARTVKATRIVRINKTYRLIRVLRSFRVPSNDPVFQVLQEAYHFPVEAVVERKELHPHDSALSESDSADYHGVGYDLSHLCTFRHDLLQHRPSRAPAEHYVRNLYSELTSNFGLYQL